LEKKLSAHPAYATAVAALHGDKHQYQRMDIIHRFKQSLVSILIATDVAARGLDVKRLATVISWDVAKDKDAHVHRIGRTGRAGKNGQAVTFLQYGKDEQKAGWVIESIQETGVAVEEHIKQFAGRQEMEQH